MRVAIIIEDVDIEAQTVKVTTEGLDEFVHERNYNVTNSRAARMAIVCHALMHKMERVEKFNPKSAGKMRVELTRWVRELFRDKAEEMKNGEL